MSLLTDAFTYFAKFPLLEGVTKNFVNSASEVNGYSTLLTSINGLTEHSIIPEIEDFVFGIDETTVKKQIKNIAGTYLFVDYGAVFVDKTNLNGETQEFLLAITIANPINPEDYDMVEEMLLTDQQLEYMKILRDKMIMDQMENPFVKDISFPHEITPVWMRELSNSIGWTMMFKKTGYELL